MIAKKISKRKKLTPDDPEFSDRISEAIRCMPPDELYAILKRRPEGMEETDMNETLRLADERDRKAEAERRCGRRKTPAKIQKNRFLSKQCQK